LRKIKTVRDLKGEAYKIIKEAIITQKLPQGSQLKESDLVARLGVSRTPIREALNQLFREGIIDIYPRQGAFVRKWTTADVLEVLILREVLEGVAARLATNRLQEESIKVLEGYFKQYENGVIGYAEADERFHSNIILASGSSRVIALTNGLRDTLQMMNMRAVTFRYPERIKNSSAEHMNIIEAFKSRDEMLAEQLTREHFRQTRLYYESHIQS
jgi:DNA-binding GntR family transcriptional regulator